MHIVTGAPGTGKTAFIARLCTERNDWLGLVNALSSTMNLKPLAAGCPCCTGKAVFQITLARALRATRAGRVFVEVSDPGHVGTLERALSEAPLGAALLISLSITLPEQGSLSAAEIEG